LSWRKYKRAVLTLVLGTAARLGADETKTITIQDPKYKVRETEKTVELMSPYGAREIIGGVGKDAHRYRIEIPLESLKPTPTPTPDPDEMKQKEADELQRMVNGDSKENREVTINKTVNKMGGDGTGDGDEDEDEEEEVAKKPKKRKPAMVEEEPKPDYDDTARLVLEANHLYNRGKFYEASIYVEELIRKKPDFARGWVMKGSLLYVQGFKDMAKQAWQKALALAPTDQEVKDLLQRYR
jgi:tetratricopeptide (TPR) repeat protein